MNIYIITVIYNPGLYPNLTVQIPRSTLNIQSPLKDRYFLITMTQGLLDNAKSIETEPL